MVRRSRIAVTGLIDNAVRRVSLLPKSLGGQTLIAVGILGSLFAFTQVFSVGPRRADAQVVLVDSNHSQAVQARASSSPDDATTLELSGLQARFDSVAKKVAPSVVAISVAIESRGEEDTLRPDDMTGRKLTGILERTTRTVGTGFVISPDGLILTNEHVISEAEQIWCTTDDGRVLPAFVVGSDPRQDLAVLRIPVGDSPLAPVSFAEPGTVKRGNWAIALGNPYGLAGEGKLAMAVGIVSATGRSLPRLSSRENRLYADLIQTTAEINPGNSGGPLFDLSGRVFGINTAVVLPQKNTNGIGFALPISSSLMNRIEELKQGMEISYADLGFVVTQPSTRQRRAAGEPTDFGIRVDEVEPTGPAATFLREGDLLMSISGTRLSDIDQYAQLTVNLRATNPVQITYVRNGKLASATLTPRRKPAPATPISSANQRYRWNGLLVGPIPSNWKFPGTARPDSGLMVLAVDSSCSSQLVPGTVIQALGNKPLRTVADLQNALATLPPAAASLTLWPNTTATSPDARATLSSGR